MADESIAQALQELQIATTAPANPMSPEHLRYQLKLVDYKDKEHAGTYELWKSEDGLRIDNDTDTYNWSALTKGEQRWAIKDGRSAPWRACVLCG